MFELSGVNYEEVLEQGDSILVRVIASSSYRGFELLGLYCIYNVESDLRSRNKQSCTPASYSMQSLVSHIHTIYLPALHAMCIC